MNEILHLLEKRTSLRLFDDRPVSSQVKDLIIHAAIQAPTAGNQLLYTILDIEDQEIKNTLAVTCDNQPFIARAPLVLIFLADCRRWLDFYQYAGTAARAPGPGDLMLACSDALIAAQNSVIAAESLGLGSCYIGDIMENYEKHAQLLALDPYVFPAAMVIYGYPAKDQENREKPGRFDSKYIVRKNTYSRLTEADSREMFTRLYPEESFSFDEYIGRFCRRKYMSDFAKELTRSVEKYLEHFQNSPPGPD